MPITSSFSGASARALGLTSSGYTTVGNGYWLNQLSKSGFSVGISNVGDYATTDASGNIYYCGFQVLTGGGDQSANLLKLDSSSAITWQRKLDELTNVELGCSVALDSSGNVYVFGRGDGPSSGDSSGVYIKYNSSGTLQWQKKLTDSYTWTIIVSAKIDSSGNIYVCGQTYNNTTNTFDGFVAKLDSSGAITWQRRVYTNNSDYLRQIFITSSGDVYTVGHTYGTSIKDKAIIVKYNSSGVLQWQREITHSDNVIGSGVVVDSSGNVYMSCYSRDTSSGSYYNGHLLKYNSSGVLQWQKKTTYSAYTTATPIQNYKLSIDSSDYLYLIAPSISYVTNYGSPTLIQKFDINGNEIFARNFNLDNISAGFSIQADIHISSANMYLRVYIGSTIDAKLPTDGSKTGKYQVGVANITYVPVSTTVILGPLVDAAGSLTDTSGSLTSSTAGLTDSANDLTITIRD